VSDLANSFFKNGDKAYAENLNDSVLVGNGFDWTLTISLPTDNGGVFPSSSDVVKGKVCDLSITPNSNLSIGSTISNSSGGSQVYRLTVYPDFNRFGGFKSISLTASSGVTFYIANKGGTSPIANNLDYTNLGNVPELKVLKEYDIVVTIPTGKSVTGLSFVLQSDGASVSASLAQSNVTGLGDSLASKVNVSDIVDNLTTDNSSKVLSAKQGKALADGKVNITDIQDNLISSSSVVPLSAKQGKILNEKIDSGIGEGWTQLNTTNNYITCYYNERLRMVWFRYYRQNYTFTSTDEVTLPTDTFIEALLKPKMNTILSSFNPTIGGGITTNAVFQVWTTTTGTKNINLTGMWVF